MIVPSLQGFEGLPGADLVERGIDDLTRGAFTEEALLVSMASTRLRATGVEVPPGSGVSAGHRLYSLLAAKHGADAHSRYNALVRRLESFARAAEHARAR